MAKDEFVVVAVVDVVVDGVQEGVVKMQTDGRNENTNTNFVMATINHAPCSLYHNHARILCRVCKPVHNKSDGYGDPCTMELSLLSSRSRC